MTAPIDPAGREAEYHPDPEINTGIAAEVLAAEAFDLSIGYAPRRWTCPQCEATHGRGHFGSIGIHRCLRCGYVGTGGAMRINDHSAEMAS